MDFYQHLEKYLPLEEIEKLKSSLENKSLHALLLNEDKLSEETLLINYPSLKKHPVVKNGFIYDKDIYQLGKSLLHELGAFYLQEPSAMMVSYLLDPKPGETILDLCAAPGGKTTQSSFLMHNKGLIVSNDLSYTRSVIIKENIERLGIGNALIISNDFTNIYHHYLNQFDKIILDAPCSGSGMFRKNDLVKLDWTYEKVLKCANIQKQLIFMAYQMLKKGGVLSYSTCSFSYEEDEEVIKYLLENTDAEILPIEDNPLYYKSAENLGIHLFPHIFPGEGHYICHIKKPGTSKNKKENPKLVKDDYAAILTYPYKKIYGPFIHCYDKEIEKKYFSIIRDGVKVGEHCHDGIKYDIHYARTINSFPRILELTFEETNQYLKGESLQKTYPKGYVLLRYLGVNIDIAKSNGEIIKNRYPKYLRKTR